MTLLYRNPLAAPSDLDGSVLEGDGATSFPTGRLRLESLRPASDGQAANVVLWLPVEAPADVEVRWTFRPVHEPGLAILFFHARGHGDRDVLDPGLAPRTGPYEQYHHGDLDAYHVSYFRRMWPSERRLHTCNLRKSHGFHLVAQGPDPLPAALDADGGYRMALRVQGGTVSFSVEGLTSLTWHDDGTTGGPALRGGRIGLRQMAPLVAEYSDLEVEAL